MRRQETGFEIYWFENKNNIYEIEIRYGKRLNSIPLFFMHILVNQEHA